MKVQIRKYGGGNYDGIGCGVHVSQVSMRKGPETQAQFDLGPKLSLPSLAHLIPFKPQSSISQPVQAKRTAQVCSEDASAVEAQSK